MSDSALNAWQNSPGHNDVILNLGPWAPQNPWSAMGVGMLGAYAVVWFGDITDPAGTIPDCSDFIFSHDFESGTTGGWAATVTG